MGSSDYEGLCGSKLKHNKNKYVFLMYVLVGFFEKPLHGIGSHAMRDHFKKLHHTVAEDNTNTDKSRWCFIQLKRINHTHHGKGR